MMLKLAVKCLIRLSTNFRGLLGDDIKVFDVLLEIYKLFRLHPPETLKVKKRNFGLIFLGRSTKYKGL
jgi:hypothetical protein